MGRIEFLDIAPEDDACKEVLDVPVNLAGLKWREEQVPEIRQVIAKAGEAEDVSYVSILLTEITVHIVLRIKMPCITLNRFTSWLQRRRHNC
eukprot:4845429-Amphidinium_carterae.1